MIDDCWEGVTGWSVDDRLDWLADLVGRITHIAFIVGWLAHLVGRITHFAFIVDWLALLVGCITHFAFIVDWLALFVGRTTHFAFIVDWLALLVDSITHFALIVSVAAGLRICENKWTQTELVDTNRTSIHKQMAQKKKKNGKQQQAEV